MSASAAATTHRDLTEEFQQLLVFGREQEDRGKRAIGDSEENRIYNRHMDVLPYDANIPEFTLIEDSRTYVNSEDEEGTPCVRKRTYYNASWIADKRAIAAQAPSLHNLRFFWTMIAQNAVTTVVSLTNPTEGEREKSLDYWTSIQEEVVLTNGKHRLVKRTLDGGKTHYHIENWTDHDVIPAEFLKDCIEKIGKVTGPLLVHCSAGVGRTGTFLAAYEAYLDQNPNLLEIAKRNRSHDQGRAGMIQTEAQYCLASGVIDLLMRKKV